MSGKGRGPVPHHRVDRALFETAQAEARKRGQSMSAIAAEGLERFLSPLSGRQRKDLLSRAQRPQEAQELPSRASQALRGYRERRDPRYPAYLTALYEAGWSLRALGQAAGVSRQAVHERILRWNGDDSGIGALPAVPKPGPMRSSPLRAPATHPSEEPVDWPIWVDRDTYLTAAQYAREEGLVMYEVMESVLRDYVKGAWRR